jgi:diguanylate cyclase (GGDEF)-like protein/PAS domain S-box-containing protein
MHNLLKRQLRKLRVSDELLPDLDSWQQLLARISNTYQQADRDRYLLEHSMDVSSDEMLKLYDDLREATEALLYVEKERAHITLQSIGDAVISTDESGKIQFMNTSAEKLTGWRFEDCMDKPIMQVFRMISDRTCSKYRDPFVVVSRECRVASIPDNTMLVRRDLSEVPVTGSFAPILNRDNSRIGSVLVFSDITAEKELKEKLEHQAHHDMLTGLCNRYHFEEMLGSLVRDAAGGDCTHAMLYMDLDQFKVVNDSCGHVAGDELLKNICNLIRGKIRSTDTLARLGGDEFGLLARDCSAESANRIAEDILGAVQQFRFNWDGRIFEVGVSIGIVEITCESTDAGAVMSEADIACYIAKENGRNSIHAFERRDATLASRKGEMKWATRITWALDEDRFALFRQAIVPVRGSSETQHHYEVLVRMQDPGGKLIAPGLFIPSAERFKLMPALDRWVISHTLEQLARDRKLREQTGMCAINLSGISLGDEGLLDFILDQITRWHIDPQTLCFEITETAVISDLANTHRLMDSLQLHGCLFALDDFGSGLSSFSYLKELPVDFLKIDGNFVKRVCEDPVDLAMVLSINHVGHVMGIKTIAEFVENMEIFRKLAEIGVDYAQGYGIEVPVPIDSPFATEADDTGDLQQSAG